MSYVEEHLRLAHLEEENRRLKKRLEQARELYCELYEVARVSGVRLTSRHRHWSSRWKGSEFFGRKS